MKTILLLENNPGYLIAFSMVLQSDGHTVLEADQSSEAARICDQADTRVDLLIAEGGIANQSSINDICAPAILIVTQPRQDDLPDVVMNKPVQRHALVMLPRPFRPEEFLCIVRDMLTHPPHLTLAA